MFRAEMLKLSTVYSTRIAIIAGLAGLAFTQIIMFWVLPVAAVSADVPDNIPLPNVDTGSFDFQYAALNLVSGGAGSGSVAIALIAILAIGILSATTDYRSGGMTAAALAQPSRGRILVGKAAATSVVIAATAVAYAIVCVAVLLASTASSSAEVVVPFADILSTVLRGVLALVLLGLCALAIGILARSQLAAFLIVIGIVTVEPIIQGVLALTGGVPAWSQMLPLALAQTAVGDLTAPTVVNPVAAMCILAAITVVIMGTAAVSLKRRDL
ncbi:hypothetical protein G7066_01510 [Leucobacter coleopterorum]|uniref:ABC-2 family transporter protein n=1 Tax=Leucobacter coleopterorum TaxID=2714933 RepID=A0ABX6JTV1_9MICO|nr:hypothetical protein [Leucobacter coleopterorum]QIM17709.1 hypothetical protein G7066_01510 [Leucobacter coleopterorum]